MPSTVFVILSLMRNQPLTLPWFPLCLRPALFLLLSGLSSIFNHLIKCTSAWVWLIISQLGIWVELLQCVPSLVFTAVGNFPVLYLQYFFAPRSLIVPLGTPIALRLMSFVALQVSGMLFSSPDSCFYLLYILQLADCNRPLFKSLIASILHLLFPRPRYHWGGGKCPRAELHRNCSSDTSAT
jgi:hypothetical protein